jgi:ABC-type transport system involved in multi-copper enzyme maturation permease subunit
VLKVALYVLREAFSRKFIQAFLLGITCALVLMGLGLRLEVVDGALAATRLFGGPMGTEVRPVDVALRPVFVGVAYLLFYGGILFGIVACADFAPSLLSPGRIEHLLALPLERWHLLAGTFLGVMGLSVGGALYGAGGLTVMLGLKTGVWMPSPLQAGLLACACFAPVYAVMLTTATFVRSASLCATLGLLALSGGIVAGKREAMAQMITEGWLRELFLGVTQLQPRLSTLASYAADLAGAEPLALRALGLLLGGVFLYALGVMAVGFWWFDGRDY